MALRSGLPERLRGDRRRFCQIFVNLASHVTEDSGVIDLALELDHAGDALVADLSFRTVGPGFDPRLDLLSGLPADRPDAVATDAIRASIARALIAAAGGVLTLAEREEGRRVVRVRLPAPPVRTERPRAHPQTRAGARPRAGARRTQRSA